MKTCIVLTSINIPTVLEALTSNARSYSHKNLEFIIIGDLKTPDVRSYIDALACDTGYDFIYLGPEDQKVWLHRFPKLSSFLPWNSVERRNIGYLIAAEHCADVILSIDDDNVPLEKYDFFEGHLIVGKELECAEVESTSGWFNLGTAMQSNPSSTFYVRGFPISKRNQPNTDFYKSVKVRIGINAGLCMGDPDVDTMTRVVNPCRIIASYWDHIVLGSNTWSPFNSQNTAFHRSLLPCMYLVTFREGSSILVGNNSFRFDDIWMSYFCRKVMDRMGDRICFGLPYVQQERNPHDYLEDLKREFPAMMMTEKLVEVLREIVLSSSSYQDGYDELIENLEGSSSKFSRLEAGWLREMIEGMKIWSETLKAV